MPSPIVISLRGGLVEEVYCTDEGTPVMVVDWDVDRGRSRKQSVVEFPFGRSEHKARVMPADVHPLFELTGSDIEAAIDAACDAGLIPA